MNDHPAEQWISIPQRKAGATKTIDAFLVEPPGPARGGIVLLQEIFGVNEGMREKARDFAAAGYRVLVPDLFWRIEPRVDLGYGEDDRKRGFGLMQQFDQRQGADDIKAAVAWLTQRDDIRPIALIGFCLGGRMAVLAGADASVDAVISLYGVRLDQCADALRALRCPFQLHVGDKDAHVPAEHVDAVRAILAGNSRAEIFIYPGAQHGFYNPVRTDVHDRTAAQQARTRILSLLASLKP